MRGEGGSLTEIRQPVRIEGHWGEQAAQQEHQLLDDQLEGQHPAGPEGRQTRQGVEQQADGKAAKAQNGEIAETFK